MEKMEIGLGEGELKANTGRNHFAGKCHTNYCARPYLQELPPPAAICGRRAPNAGEASELRTCQRRLLHRGPAAQRGEPARAGQGGTAPAGNAPPSAAGTDTPGTAPLGRHTRRWGDTPARRWEHPRSARQVRCGPAPPRPAPRAPAEVAHAEAAERPPGFRSGAGPARARPQPGAMLRGLGSWLGLERAGEEQLLPAGERSGPAEREEEEEAGLAGQEQGELQGDSEALLSQAKGFGSECPAAKETRLQVCLSVIASFRAVFKGVACLKYLFCWQCGRRSVGGENRSVYVE